MWVGTCANVPNPLSTASLHDRVVFLTCSCSATKSNVRCEQFTTAEETTEIKFLAIARLKAIHVHSSLELTTYDLPRFAWSCAQAQTTCCNELRAACLPSCSAGLSLSIKLVAMFLWYAFVTISASPTSVCYCHFTPRVA